MILSDKSIKEELSKKRLLIDPIDYNDIQPSSVDLYLFGEVLIFKNSAVPYIDLRQPAPELMEKVDITPQSPFILHPGEFALGSTREIIHIPNDLIGQLEGKSSLGRLGLLVHSTAGYVDPGWKGRLTLELANVSRLPIALYPDMKVCQIFFQKMTSDAERPYGTEGLNSHYQHQSGPVPSKAHQDI